MMRTNYLKRREKILSTERIVGVEGITFDVDVLLLPSKSKGTNQEM